MAYTGKNIIFSKKIELLCYYGRRLKRWVKLDNDKSFKQGKAAKKYNFNKRSKTECYTKA